jgi:hypothetical protein
MAAGPASWQQRALFPDILDMKKKEQEAMKDAILQRKAPSDFKASKRDKIETPDSMITPRTRFANWLGWIDIHILPL